MAPQLRREDYTVAWVCALPIELAAAEEMLDEEHATPPCDAHDTNIYTCGRLGEHNVVIACLPEGQMGTNPAAVVAVQMKSSFTSTRFGLMVGIGGGVPSEADIRLGDVVVSRPLNTHGGVVQYDSGKTTSSGFERTGSLNSPPTTLLTAVAKLKAKHIRGLGKFLEYFSKLENLPDFGREAAGPDILFMPEYEHEEGQATCERCNLGNAVTRNTRRQEVMVHYGTIASGDQVIRSAAQRDAVSKELGGVLCFEMEAAGLMNNFPCLVIRGICDYADSHKNKQWQPYAAGMAAAYAKEVLSMIPQSMIESEKKIVDVLSDLQGIVEDHLNIAQDELTVSTRSLEIQQEARDQELSDRQKNCLHLFRLTNNTKDATYERYKDRIEERVAGTCMWLLEHEHFQSWMRQKSGPLLVSADPGCGKSVLAKYLIDHVLPESATVCYFFFKDQDQNTVRQALCALLHQLFSQRPALIKHAMEQFDKDGKGLVDSTNSLWKILDCSMQDQEAGPIVIVLDALDECAESEYEGLMRNIEKQSRAGGGKLKYLLTSRPYESIVAGFRCLSQSFPRIHIPGEEESETISQEVNFVIRHRVKHLARDANLTAEIEDCLVNQLLKIEHRTYLWVYLVFDHLRTEGFKKTRRGVELTIESLPKSVNEAYEKILSKSKERPTVEKVLAIILAATRPLTLSELSVAIEIDDTIQTLRDVDLEDEEDFKSRLRFWCGLFVSVYHGKIYFLHQTAREFLLSKEVSLGDCPKLQWKGFTTIRHAHTVLAERCVRLLWLLDYDIGITADGSSDSDSDLIEERVSPEDCDFLEYSATFWNIHFRESHFCFDERSTVALLAFQLSDPKSSPYRIWAWIYWSSTKLESDFKFNGPLSIACYFGHISVVKLSLNQGDQANVQGGYLYAEVLSIASAQGHKQVVEMLLDAGAEVNLPNGRLINALQAASMSGQTQVVEFLLERGADVNAQYGSDTALQCAAQGGHTQVVDLLLQKGADVNAQGAGFGTALQHASMSGRTQLVEFLLEQGAEVNTHSLNGETALSVASRNGDDRVVDMLLKAGADPSSGHAYRQASDNCHKRVMWLLTLAGGDKHC